MEKNYPEKRALSIAPMLGYTNADLRFFFRLLTKRTTLCFQLNWSDEAHNVLNRTEMVNAESILYNPETLLRMDAQLEPPCILQESIQLGGANSNQMEQASKLAAGQMYAYTGLNLNCGCPSTKVSDKCFGASLMLKPDIVAECLLAIKKAGLPVSIKCRIGVNDCEGYDFMSEFIDSIYFKTGVSNWTIHARKAILGKRFTTQQNRSIPPLTYDVPYRLAEKYNNIAVELNGGVISLEEAVGHFEAAPLTGIMIGRAACNNPWLFSIVDEAFYGSSRSNTTRRMVMEKYSEYADKILESIAPSSPASFVKHKAKLLMRCLPPLVFGVRKAKDFKSELTILLDEDPMGFTYAVDRALEKLPENAVDSEPEASEKLIERISALPQITRL